MALPAWRRRGERTRRRRVPPRHCRPSPRRRRCRPRRRTSGRELVHLAWELARLASPPAPAEGGRCCCSRSPCSRRSATAARGCRSVDRGGPPATALLAPARRPADGDLRAVAASCSLPRRRASRSARPLGGSALAAAAARGTGAAGDYRPLLRAGGFLYAQRLWQLERRVVARLRELLAAPLAADGIAAAATPRSPTCAPARRSTRPAARCSSPTSRRPRCARRSAAGSTAITGGPGTGKTWIVAALLRVVARLGDPPLDRGRPRRTHRQGRRPAAGLAARRARRRSPIPARPTRACSPRRSPPRRCTGCSPTRPAASASSATSATRSPSGW